MGIRFCCQHCHEQLNVKARYAGKDAICPKCEKSIRVPDQSTITKRDSSEKGKPKADHSARPRVLKDEQKTVASIGETQEFQRDEFATLDTEQGNKKAASVKAAADLPQTVAPPKPAAPGPENERTNQDADSFLLDKPSNPWLEPNAPDPIKTGLKKVWYVRHPKDGEIGPIKGKNITTMIDEKKINAACYVWREDWEDWIRADMVFRRLELPKGANTDGDRVFTDPNCPIPKSYLKKATAEETKKKRQQILLVVAIIVGIGTISLLGWLLALLL